MDELVAKKLKAHRLSQEFSNLYEEDAQARQEILEKLVESVGEGTFMLGPIRFHYGCHTRIGAHCFMNFNFTVQDDARVTIGDYCNFGPNVVVCPGVTIGDNCVIGAGSVVTRDIPANTFAAGAPARGFRPITEQDDIAKLFPELRQGRFSASIARSICSKSLVWGYSAMSGWCRKAAGAFIAFREMAASMQPLSRISAMFSAEKSAVYT